WLSELNGNHHYGSKEKGIKYGDILEELEARRLAKDEGEEKASNSQLTPIVIVDKGNKDWRKFEDKHSGLTHFEELLIFQPKNWLLRAREYIFRYNCDIDRASPLSLKSSKKHRTVTVAGEEISLRTPIEIVLLHKDLVKRPDRYAPLNFLLAYGASDPLSSWNEKLGEEKFAAIEKYLSPLPYFIDFRKYVASYDLQKLKQIGKLAKFPCVCLVKELDFSPTIVGQRLAKSIIRQAIVSYIHSRSNTSQPLSMIFVGPSGNGKTELARYLSNLINKPESHATISISVTAGSQAGSALNNFIVKMSGEPQSVGIVLLDEVEKANRDVITAFYQVFDKGEWTNKRLELDLQTEIIPCKNIIFIMTSNACDKHIMQYAESNMDLYIGDGMTFEDYGRKLEADLRSLLRSKHPFDDAFIGRVGRIVPFLPMAKGTTDMHHPLLGEMMTITKILIEKEQEMYVDVEAINIEQVIDPETKHSMASIIVDESIKETGVRSIVTQVRSQMSHRVLHSSLLEKGGIQKGAAVQYSAQEEERIIDFRPLNGGVDTDNTKEDNTDDDLSELYS
ncbi:hypothetical protein ACHAWF_011255, partial [Thalassiosira exigua]